MSQASPFWQGILFFAGGLILLWELWGGWRRGLIRSAVHFTALVFSGFIGILAGQLVAAVVGKFLPGPALFLGLFVGAVVTLLTLGLALLFGAILFKRTAQQPTGMLRWVYGSGGAFFGLLTGLAIVWGAITLVRVFGAVAEPVVASHPASEAPPVARMLVTLKESLELGPAGKIVESVDVLPPQIYEMIVHIGKLNSDNDAMKRFLDYPGTQKILQNPSMARLLRDPVFVSAAEQHDFFSLIQNRDIPNALSDPELQKLLTEFDLKNALDYAFPNAQASPIPEKHR